MIHWTAPYNYRDYPSSGVSRGARGTCVPRGPKFFQFHAVFGKIWQNCMLAAPPGELAPHPRGILDPPLPSPHPFCVQGSIHPDMFELVHNKARTVRMASGRLASYWNIFLFQSFLLHSMTFSRYSERHIKENDLH